MRKIQTVSDWQKHSYERYITCGKKVAATLYYLADESRYRKVKSNFVAIIKY